MTCVLLRKRVMKTKHSSCASCPLLQKLRESQVAAASPATLKERLNEVRSFLF